MILACHQPQYLAWLGYYDKMARCDLFVYLDGVQYKRREFQNRNRIKTPHGPLWLTVPVRSKGRRAQTVAAVETDPGQDWAREHALTLRHHYRRAARYAEQEAFLDDFYGRPWPRLAPACYALDARLREQFGIKTPTVLESEVGSQGTATARLLSLCRRLKADAYLSGAGGRDYLDEEEFARAGIGLLYQEYAPPTYPQGPGPFLPRLAALDLLLHGGAEAWTRSVNLRCDESRMAAGPKMC